MNRLSRRTFLKHSSLAAGAALTIPRSSSLRAATTAPAAIRPKLAQFEYAQVRLLDGPMLEQFDRNHRFFLGLDEDGLLKPFRERAGQPAPGPVMGGWYNDNPAYDPPKNMTGYIPGHSFGQYLSGLARAYAITGNKPTQEKVQRLVKGFAPTVTEKFYVDYPLPAYTFDKTNIGLLDAHQFAGDSHALPVLSRAVDAVLPHLPAGPQTREEACAVPHKNISYCWDETYTLPENFYLAYLRSGDARYRQLAARFLQDKDYFTPLSQDENVLPGLHAYSHLNALASAVQSYLVDGSQMHLRAARNGFRMIQQTQSFATGGWGPDETFRKPGSGDMGASLTKTHASFETPCGAYGHFKVTRYLMRITGDSAYGDSMESMLYNTILGAKPILEDGTSFYYADYNNVASKFYHQDKWPCCSGTFPQVTADYGISSYFQSPEGVHVNLYVPSQLTWTQNGSRCVLTQRTEYPYHPEVTLEVRTERPESFAIALRIPAWAGPGTHVAINGKAIAEEVRPGIFLSLHRTWKDGDRIELTLDRTYRLIQVDPEHPNLVALLHGPLSLFAVGETPATLSRRELLAAQERSGSWSVSSGSDAVTLLSYPQIKDEKYRLYLPVSV
ncbi:beta-L-arabinofuranosidase domain-containing protein [Silvibacterium dinghuense]|uniref:Twin-arginine translocation signal domain-containing protein n=1 Tax=Silvibacterium dinghuense TaxID=1560006 RepID=A0A4Q1SE50_9BACT|nr:beta-L-arabinofuranosidase domain-containing protein [Silvibacterium dinghuense]RXS95539.1 twin-arginine translocation signal domain-containing protein [Silvibacterium dinghuense]GGH13865.1 glycosyl hydrolase [Silvibacterium dinghuense]